jgi:hypothetical protein
MRNVSTMGLSHSLRDLSQSIQQCTKCFSFKAIIIESECGSETVEYMVGYIVITLLSTLK